MNRKTQTSLPHLGVTLWHGGSHSSSALALHLLLMKAGDMIVPFITFGPRNQNVNGALLYPECSSSKAAAPSCRRTVIFIPVSEGLADNTIDFDLC